ncbi:MAG: tetraacyldisaccharide 4'-kinase [Bacteroidia bacterium]
MKKLRLVLLPFSLIYGLVTAIRNALYNNGVFASCGFSIPVIAVGNLSTGGTGKTPQTEYLIRLLAPIYKVAVLSRGYGRKSEGYVLANETASAQTLGDEPFQFFTKFKDSIRVAVDANRVAGITNLLGLSPKPEVIVLDDAYQHRKVTAGFYILLTAYGDIYTDDFILPAGNLRESRSGAKRAGVIVVTKCPTDISAKEQQQIIGRLKPKQGQQVFFSCIAYDDLVYGDNGTKSVTDIKNEPKVLVAGIAKPQPFYDYLKSDGDSVKTYPDHHEFTETEINELIQLSETKTIVTTEKDYMRLKGRLPQCKLFYLPIKSRFITGGNNFDKTILNYVERSTANSRLH